MNDLERAAAILTLQQLARDQEDIRVLRDEMHLLLWELQFTIEHIREGR